MQSINRILVCLDPDREQQPALQKAIYLAKIYQAEIDLLLVVYKRSLVNNLFFSSEQFELAKQGYVRSQKKWVNGYLKEVEKADISCRSEVIWHKPLYEAVLQKAEEMKADLVIKSTHEHPTINKVFFTPNDWQLLKSCPVPLILAKAETSSQYNKVLCAIDPSHAHGKPETLDPKILQTGKDVCKVLDSDCHVTHCYDPISFQLWSDIGLGMGVGMGPTDFAMGEENYDSYLQQLKKNQEEKFDKTVREFQFDKEQLHLVEGYPETLLPELVKQMKIDLLVLGTTYHSGLVGSTAEKILDNINCDVLSVQIAKS
ncbi:universal stress protein [Aliikangiella coralliicola]|uniref:Universal stress protein n=1 Tax=Aliikangiella coralliicola TaxID=2592383 RepID=A0A545UD54_9GAMM|nr:universal stress protein [Aliikangiella coralliicola]TQV87397.1 universal stress protein [Aliikangiella coralliicola]